MSLLLNTDFRVIYEHLNQMENRCIYKHEGMWNFRINMPSQNKSVYRCAALSLILRTEMIFAVGVCVGVHVCMCVCDDVWYTCVLTWECENVPVCM